MAIAPLNQVNEVKLASSNLEQSTEFKFLITQIRSITTFTPPKLLISIKCDGKPAIQMLLQGGREEAKDIVHGFQAAVGPGYDFVELPIANAWQSLQFQTLIGLVLVAAWAVVFFLTLNYTHLRETNALERNNGVTRVIAWINEHVGPGQLLVIGLVVALLIAIWSAITLMRRAKYEGLRKM